MITEEMLKTAAGELDACMEADLSAQPEHLFSQRFRRKMDRLVRKTDYPVRYALTACAAILALALTIFASLMTFSPTVRAAVVEWLKGPAIDGVAYTYQGQPSRADQRYTLPNIPEGYELVKTSEDDFGGTYRYRTKDGKVLLFKYIFGSDATTLYMETKDCVYQNVMVGDEAADMYIPQSRYDIPTVVWTDPSTGALLLLAYGGEQDALIDLAEAVEISEKN